MKKEKTQIGNYFEIPEDNKLLLENLIISGLDLSYTNTGCTTIDLKNKTIKTVGIKTGCPDKSFYGMQNSISSIISKLDEELINTELLVLEEPFPGTIFSSGLYGLDSSVFQHFKSKIIHTFHPTILKKIHGKKYVKKDSIALAKTILETLTKELGFSFLSCQNMSEKKPSYSAITHDESESFIYTIVSCIRLGYKQFECFNELLNIKTTHVADWNLYKDISKH